MVNLNSTVLYCSILTLENVDTAVLLLYFDDIDTWL